MAISCVGSLFEIVKPVRLDRSRQYDQKIHHHHDGYPHIRSLRRLRDDEQLLYHMRRGTSCEAPCT
jgi:hypothetical protein